MTNQTTAQATSELSLAITRIFDAPRSLVFAAWTDPKHMKHWWGPKGYTLPECEMDVRVGGRYRFCMRSPDGVESRNEGIFRDVEKPSRIVMSGCWVDPDGKPRSPMMVTTIELEERNGGTLLTLTTTGFESIESRESHRGGWASSIERLAEYLPTATRE